MALYFGTLAVFETLKFTKRRSPLRHGNIARLALVLAVLQLAYWLVFAPNFVSYRAAERPEFIEVQSTQQARLRSPDFAALQAADFEEYDPEIRILERGYYATRVTFTLENVPESGIAILDLASGDHIRFYVNGSLLNATGEAMLPSPTYHGLQKRIVPVSSGLLNVGLNRIDVVATFDVARQASVDPPLVADFEEAETAYAWTDFLSNDYRNFTIAVALTLALMVGAAALRASERMIPIWLFLLTLAWSLHSLFYRWVNFPLAGNERVLFYSLVFLFMSASWPAFVDAWTKRPVRYFQTAMMVIFALASAGAVYWLAIDQSAQAFTNVEGILDQVGLIFVVLTIARLVWHFVRNPDEGRIVEGAALILLASLIGFFLYNTWVHDTYVGHLQAAQPLLLVVLVVGFFASKFHLFRSSDQINQLLQSKLDLRETELAAAHDREKVLVRDQAFDEERQRIMRDMHDGLGSSLMSMMMMARNGRGSHREFEDGLQSAIDEMRLMIESMDSVGDSMRTGLSVFRRRVIPRAEDAGYSVNWIAPPNLSFYKHSPRDVLQVFRILQEAVSNAIRHSRGNRLIVEMISDVETGHCASISVTDNGHGYDPDRSSSIGETGRGVRNMRARAKGIGAQLVIEPAEPGTRVQLTFQPQE